MKWWGDNIKQALKFFAFSIFTVLASMNKVDLSLRQLHDFGTRSIQTHACVML